MFLDKKPFIYLWRPIYWLVFDKIVHPISLGLWNYLLLQPLPPSPPANSMAARLQGTLDRIDAAQAGLQREFAESKAERLASERLAQADLQRQQAESKQEWLATEKLILALMQEPGAQSAPPATAQPGSVN